MREKEKERMTLSFPVGQLRENVVVPLTETGTQQGSRFGREEEDNLFGLGRAE